MKRTLVLSLAVLTYFASCKKDSGDSTPQAQMHAKMDGNAVTFDSTLKAKWTTTTVSGSSVTALLIQGSKTSGGDILQLEVAPTSSSKKVDVGTYSESNTTTYLTSGVYFPKDSSASKTLLGFIAGVSPSPTNPLQVVISSIDATTVKGTFKGDFYYTFYNAADSNYYFSSANKKTFSEGTFTAKF